MYASLVLILRREISLGKYGTFSANLLLERPYHLTFEIVDCETGSSPRLRTVPAAELHAEDILSEDDDLSDSRDEREVIFAEGVES
jgi:tRNA (adenine58-N1)-methyltransferase non-catalytic subunit